MISRLEDDERAEQGLPITPAVDTCWSSTCKRCRVLVQVHAWKAAAVDSAVAKAAREGALRARTHTHTHSLTLPAKEERAGDLPSTRADIHCARWHIHSDSVQKGPKYFMHFLCIATCTYMQPLQPYCIYCICDILFIASIYIAYCLYVTYILYIAYSPYIA